MATCKLVSKSKVTIDGTECTIHHHDNGIVLIDLGEDHEGLDRYNSIEIASEYLGFNLSDVQPIELY